MASADSRESDETRLDDVLEVLGGRIRGLRSRQGLTLQELALKAGISVSMLSTVERGQTSASLATLHALADALDVRMSSLFAASDELAEPVTRRDDQQTETMPGGLRRRLAVDHPDNSFELYLDEYPTGTAHALRPSRHNGYEYGLVLQGDLDVDLDGTVYRLRDGDSIHYPAGRGHLITNAGDVPARAVWVNLRRL